MATERGEHIVLGAVEHSAVREASARHDATVVGVDRAGRISTDELLDALRPDTALVHLQWANHEVGTIQRVTDVVAACRERGVLVHVDAAQAPGHVPIDFVGLGADLLSVSAHKLGGPPGTGALLVRRGLRLRPLHVGGDQERARRAGYENVPGIIGFGAACADLDLPAEAERARAWTTGLAEAAGAGRLGPGVHLLGDPDAHGRLPHLLCLGMEGVEAEPVLLGLDQAGVAVHSGSSCSSESLEPSPVLEAMGVDASRSLRVSVGWSTVEEDVDAFADALPPVLERLLALGA
jgi:cysteine desulfurase